MAHVYIRSGAAGAGTGADWANAYTTLAAALTAKAAGDQFWVAGDHSESTASAVSFTSPGTATAPCTIRCVNHAGTVPPVSADLLATALVVNTGTFNMNFAGGYADCDGIEFRCATGGAGTLTVGTTVGFWKFGPNTRLTLTGTSGVIAIGAAAGPNIVVKVEFNGTILKFAVVGNGIRLQGANFRWRGGSVDATGAIPTTLFLTASAWGNVAVLEAVDLSALGSGKTLIGAVTCPADIHLKDCKIDAAVTFTAATTGHGGYRLFVSRTNGSAIAYGVRQYLYAGSEIAGIDVVRDNGSSAAHKIVTTANAKFIMPYSGLPLFKWNPTTGANVIVTVEGIANMAAMPKNDEVWFDIEYLGTSGFPLGVIKSGAKADILATGANLTASTQAWDGGATARANTTVYVAGDVIKVASNSGRVFFCTTGGTTAGSEPAGYATSVDGDSVTDNTAVFRAGWRFKQAVTLTSPQPQFAGALYAYPRVGAASATVYLDRKLELS